MILTDDLLLSLGFERIFSDFFRKKKYGLMKSFRYEGIVYINFNSILRTLEELKEDYKEKTGEELDDINAANLK
jgi:hypothetical protein